MKKYSILVAILLVCALIFTGCSNASTTVAPTSKAPAPAPTTATSVPLTSKTPAPTSIAPTPTSTVFVPKPGAADPSVKTGGILKVAVPTDAVGLGQPSMGKVMWDQMLAGPAIENLANQDSQGNYVPWLAESWQQDKNAMTVTVTLRKGITFSDGTPFNAAAVKWNLELNMAKKLPSAMNIKSVDVVDDYTVKCNLGSWSPNVALSIIGSFMVSPTAWQKNGEDWGKQNPVGTGPFVFSSRQREANIKYSKNPDYWQKGKPYLDGIEFDTIADPTTRLASFKAGEVDMTIDPSIDQCQSLSQDSKYMIHILHNGLNTYLLGPSANDPASPFSKLKVRQALGYAVDRELLVKSVLGGYGSVANQQWLPGSWPYIPNYKGYTYDLAKAKQLLADAGYSDGFSSKLIASSATASESQVATALQGMLSKAGITVTLDLQGPSALENSYRTGWDGLIILGLSPSPGLVTFTISGSLASKPRFYFASLLNSNALDAAIADALGSADMQTYAAKVQKLDDLVYYQEAQLIPMFYGDGLLVKYPYVTDDNFYMAIGVKLSGLENAWLKK
jgi:peptide/nickel transport system substrate-binding protein